MAYSISAEDWPGLGHIIDHVLDEYISNGASFPLIEIPPLMNSPRSLHILTACFDNSSFHTGTSQPASGPRCICPSADVCSSLCTIPPAVCARRVPRCLLGCLVDVPRRPRTKIVVGAPALGFCTPSAAQYAPSIFITVILGFTALWIGPELLFSSSDVVELLRKLNEIFVRTSQGAGGDYLRVMIRSLKSGGEQEALDRLKLVRLALAKYYGRCTGGPSG